MKCTRLPLIAALAALALTTACEEEVGTPDSPPSAELGVGGDDLPPKRAPKADNTGDVGDVGVLTEPAAPPSTKKVPPPTEKATPPVESDDQP